MATTTIPALGQYGFVADQPAQELPPNALTSVRNVRFRNGSAERFGGHVSVFSAPSVTPYYVAPFGTATSRFWIHSGLASTFADDGTTRTDITGTAFTGGVDDRFTGGALHGLFIINNGVDAPKYWDGNIANNLATLTAWDATWRVKWIRPFRNYLVYGFPTKSGAAYPHTVGWSAPADPGTLPTTYDPAAAATGLDVGDVPLGETPDQLVDGLPLGEVFLIYKEQSIYRMEYTGGQQVFAFKRIPGNYGALARGCIASTPKGHVVLANGDVVLVDGFGEPKPLLVGVLRDWFFQSQLDSENAKRSFVVANTAKSEVWVCYPTIGSAVPDKALVWNWIDSTWGLRDLPNATYAAAGLISTTTTDTNDSQVGTNDSAAGANDQNDFTPSDSRLIMCSTAPGLYLADAENTFAGSAIPASIERTGLVFGDTTRTKTWLSMTPRIDAPVGTAVYIQFGGSMKIGEEPTWSAPITFTVGTDEIAYGFASGKYLAYRIYSTGAQGWAIKSIDCDVAFGGKY